MVIKKNLERLKKRGWLLKPYTLWGESKPCPSRLVVNVYSGCEYAHKYCYISSEVKTRPGFREHLNNRIKEAKNYGLDDVLVIVSSSTDPFQPKEKKERDSLYALETLLGNNFPVLVMTRNPQMLLEPEYSSVVKYQRLYVDVSVPSLSETEEDSIFYSKLGQNYEDIFKGISELVALGKSVRVKIEPIIPTLDDVKGQTQEEIKKIVKLAKKSGVKAIISKTMRLNKYVPKSLYEKLGSYYRKNGELEQYGTISNLVLNRELRKELLLPVYEACAEYKIPFCPCVEKDVFIAEKKESKGKIIDCRVDYEEKLKKKEDSKGEIIECKVDYERNKS